MSNYWLDKINKDFWIPVKPSSPASVRVYAQNLGEIDDLVDFKNKLYTPFKFPDKLYTPNPTSKNNYK